MEASAEKKEEYHTLLDTLKEMFSYLLVNPGEEYDTRKWCSIMKDTTGQSLNVYEQEVGMITKSLI